MPRLAFSFAVLLAAAAAQSPAPQAPAPVARDVAVQLVSHLDALIDHLAKAKGSVDAARRLAVDDDTQKQLRDTAELLVERIASLQARRAKAAENLPLESTNVVLWLQGEATKAWDLKKLQDTVNAVVALEAGLEKDVEAARQANKPTKEIERARMLASYYVAEAWRRKAEFDASTAGSASAVETRRKMQKKLDEIAAQPKDLDFAYSGEGTSLQAAALRNSIRIQVSTYWGYAKLAERDPAKYGASATDARTRLLTAFEELGRRFTSDTAADGKSFVEDVRAAVEQIKQRR